MPVIGTAGHVDHGKSALVTRLTGIDPDRWAEEKRRGLTIDLGFAWLTLPSGIEVGIVDVPGHERFIRNMLAGAGSIGVCLFVVAANEGWKPQSAEHLTVIDMLGIGSGVVALTKSDLVEDHELERITADTAARLAPSSLAGAHIVACSAVTGAGISDLVAALDAAVARAPAPEDSGRPRLWVDRVFSMAGAGTVVTGTLAGGTFRVGDEVEIAPHGHRARVRSIQSHKRPVEEIGPGHRVAMNLAGLEKTGTERGNAVVHVGEWRVTHTVDALVRVAPEELSGHAYELAERGSYHLHCGSAETPVTITLFSGSRLRAGQEGFAQIRMRAALPVARGDRFVLRDAGRTLTVGGGIVLDPLPHRARRNDMARVTLLTRLRDATPDEAVAALVDDAGELHAAEALWRGGAATRPSAVAAIGAVLVSPSRLDELQAAVRDVLSRHHAGNPLQKGLAREALRAHLGIEPDALADLLEAMDDVAREGALVRLITHAVTLGPDQQRRREALLTALDAAPFAPPHIDEERGFLRALEDAGDIVRIEDFYVTANAAAEARQRVRDAIASSGPMTVAQIRDLLGTTRKYAVPLCEWLDNTGATLRRGDVRHLGPNP